MQYLKAYLLFAFLGVYGSLWGQQQTLPAAAEKTFTNPLLPSGADPWVVWYADNYYYMQTMGSRLVIWKTKNLAELAAAPRKTIWKAPQGTAYSHDIWAPELHRIDGKWYVYFAADNGENRTHRMYVLENENADPLEGTWTFKGKIADPSDRWAIDGSVFQYRGQWYMIWSGWHGDRNGQQNIYIAAMKNPWTIKGQRVKISAPTLPWETHGDLSGDPPHVNVNEGPQILFHNDDVFLIYSASGCWTDYYALGLLQLTDKKDLLNPASWKKYDQPVFQQAPQNEVYAPGHNSFFVSPDGKENWILYHANDHPGDGCGSQRSPRMQPFGWRLDGQPDFGVPVKKGQPLPLPSGTP